MTLLEALRLLRRRWYLVAAVPLIAAATTFAFVRDAPDEFATEASVYTGLSAGPRAELDAGADYHAVNAAFDNLIALVRARGTVEEVALEILAGRLASPRAVREGLGVGLDQELTDRLAEAASGPRPASLGDTPDGGAAPSILARLQMQKDDPASAVYEALYRTDSPFAVQTILEGLEVERVRSSDIINLRYHGTDPSLTQRTLALLLDAFMERHSTLKAGEGADMIAFFEAETDAARSDLDASVGSLRSFAAEHGIINYYEQTKHIASQGETIDDQLRIAQSQLTAAEGALVQLEERLGVQQELQTASSDVLATRRRLSDLTTQATIQEATGTVPDSLRRAIARTQQALSNRVRQLDDVGATREGIAQDQIVDNWLDALVDQSEARARVSLLQGRRQEYQRVYRQFSPLGSTLQSLEREVDIAERTYLEMLNSLNQARMRQQSLEMAADLEVVDPPYYPERPLPSKMSLLTLLAFMAGLVLSVGGVLATELLDRTVRTPARAQAQTGLRPATAYPVVPASRAAAPSEPDPHFGEVPAPPTSPLARALQALDAQLVSALKLALPAPQEGEPQMIAVASRIEGEGKSFVTARLAGRLRDAGHRVLVVQPEDPGAPPQGAASAPADTAPYAVRPDFSETDVVDALAGRSGRALRAYDYVLLELPSLVHNPVPVALLQAADGALLVLRADRVWTDADEHLLDGLKQSLESAPLLVLNAVRPERLEGLIGEVSGRRSGLRRLGKRLATGQLAS